MEYKNTSIAANEQVMIHMDMSLGNLTEGSRMMVNIIV